MALPAQILFLHVSRIGDTLFATPAIRATALAFPEARITVLAHPKRAEVLEHLPFINRVGRITKKSAPWRGRLGGKTYDLAFVYGHDEPLVAYALRVARKVVAFQQADGSLNAALDIAVPVPEFQNQHAVHHYLRLPATHGVAPAGYRLSYQVLPKERDWANGRLVAEGFQGQRPLVGLQVASFPTRSYRDWPVEHFRELCGRISAQWPEARFLIFGGPEERERTAWLKEQLGARAALFAGTLTLRQTGALMSRTHLYVGVDTGPTHLMSTFDIPLVGLYHCTSSSAHTGPLDHPMAALLNHPLSDTGRCSEQSTMADIGVDEVFAAVQRLLKEQ